MSSPRLSSKKPFVSNAYALARERYAALGVDTESALTRLASIPLSLPCWQGDDVGGFEPARPSSPSGGIAITGSYPGKARSADELRADFQKALSLIPGAHRLNLHASYGEFHRKPADRNAIDPSHFQDWIAWGRTHHIGLDFNPTFFSHPKASDGFTLSHPKRPIRAFWVEHGLRCREIAAAIAKAFRSPTLVNFWIPDGSKDSPADRKGPRERLTESLDLIFTTPLRGVLDSVEPKLFGIGSESYVVGSYDFYLSYAVSRQKWLCLDSGHFHPTEQVADKLSSVLPFLPGVLLHASRGVRWDSDHVVLQNDETLALTREIIANGLQKRTRLGLDYFDATINRIAAWVIGARALLRSLLIALLEPTEAMRASEASGDYTSRLALQEELKAMPFGAVWDAYCERQNVPTGTSWIAEVRAYEDAVLASRRSS